MLAALLNLYSFVVLASVLLSWFPEARNNAFGRFIENSTEPVFRQVRKVVPSAGGFDISPMIVLVLLHVLRAALR